MKRRRKALLLVGAPLAVLALSWPAYTAWARKTLEEEIAEARRNPGDGIILGTEAKTLPGEGEKACLLVHGWLGSRIDFHDLGKRLQRAGLTVRMVRLPGHGTTPLDLEAQGPDDFLEALRAEYRALKESHRDVAVVGFSMGGALATLLASEGLADRLVLIAPYFRVTYKPYYLLRPETWNRLLRPFMRYVVKGRSFVRVNREEARSRIFSYRVVPTKAVAVLCEVGRRARSPAVLRKVVCPVLLLHARGDGAASPEAAEEAFASLGSREKKRFLFDRSDHHLAWDYDGPEAMEMITAFLARD